MDAYQQSHHYMRPPPAPPQQPPPMADHYHYQNPYFQQQQPPPQQPRQPVPPQGHQWYSNSNQFQYQPPPPSHSTSPPPPSQWAPPPPPPPPPHPAHHYPLPPRPHVPPPPPPPTQYYQSYPQTNHDWANPNWSHHHQGWDYAAQNNAQDWAARAKEWANARAAMDNQHMQSQYPQSADFHYADTQQQLIPASSYQQFPVTAAQPHQPPVAHQQENVAISSASSSYGPDMHIPYSGRDGAPAGETNVGFPHQESSRFSPSGHQQEVPSSYSSITGTEGTANQKEHTYRSFPMPISSAQEGQPFAYGNQAAYPPTDLSDQPLDFAPRFNHDQDLHMQSSYAAHHESAGTVRGVDPVAAVPSVNSWTHPVASGVYPPIPPVLPAGPQHDPSIAMASVPGPAAPQFGRFPGPGFHPSIPSASGFGIGAGATLHPMTTFPGDVYGVSGVSERPKKAPVPNWLKEEIIKNKAAITKSSLENPKGEPQSIEEVVHQSSGKGDQADSKSIDSSRSTEEDDDDEDYVEATKTAAINQEIKRILTEVLLKVTDELFDEIATKVLSEDDLAIEINVKNVNSHYKVSPPPPAIPTLKASSAKVIVPVKAKESETEGTSEKTSSSTPGDVLGLANYASDDDDGDDEIQSSNMPNSRNNVVQQSSMNKHSEYINDAAENGLHVKPEKKNKAQTHSGRDLSKTNDVSVINVLSENKVDTRAYSSNAVSGDGGNENSVDGSGLNETLGEKDGMKTKCEQSGTNVGVKISTNDNSPSTETRMKSEKNDRYRSKKSSLKDSDKEVEIGSGVDDKGDQSRRRQDERHSRKEKTDYQNGYRDKTRDEGAKSKEKAKESKSRKRSTDDVKEDIKDAERNLRGSTKEGIDKKRERLKEEDKSRYKLTSDSGRHKKSRFSPISSKGRNSKENSVSHINDSSDQSSDESKRKRRSRKRHSSPSPVRSSRRQVTRSPHSKHSQRRHSPYSSLETTSRKRRSRSRSPVRRQR